MSSSSSSYASSATVIRPEDYAHSPIHYAVALSDHATLTKLLNSLPKPPQLTRDETLTVSKSLAMEQIVDQISAALDRRDNVLKETPLHLAVRLNDAAGVKLLAGAGADASLQNVAGWNPLQEALLRRRPEIVKTLVQHHHAAAWNKWLRRLPRLVAALRRMRDFYMEIEFHFESSIVPFVNKIAPSDTYRIWKRDGNLRADTSLAGYDGLKIQRANQSFLFLNDGDGDVRRGSLIILNHDEKKIYDAFENAGNPLSDSDITNFCNQTSVYRPGMDVTKAELIGRTNWRRQEKTEHVGDYRARIYEMHNVAFTFRSRKLNNNASEEMLSPTCVLPLEIDDEGDDDFIVAENPRFSVSACNNDRTRRHSSFVREDRDYVTVSRKSVDIIPAVVRRNVMAAKVAAPPPQTKEKEFAKNLRPTVWLTEHFPLKTEELTPLLDILANKVKAVRRLREVLTTTFPPGTFPVKVSIPVVPTVRVVITFTKFMEVQPVDTFYTPMSSPRQLVNSGRNGEDDECTSGRGGGYFSSSWMRSGGSHQQKGGSGGGVCDDGCVQTVDHFAIPSGYSWSSFDQKNRKMKKSRSVGRTK